MARPTPPSYAGGRQATPEEISLELVLLAAIRGTRKGKNLLRRVETLWATRGNADQPHWRKSCDELLAQVSAKGLEMCMGGEGYDIRAVLEAMQGWASARREGNDP